jgi:glycosyltransferase involved in cell wall biosynthesis
MSKIRVALVGNIANNFYREAKALQASAVMDVHLFCEEEPASHTMLPQSDEPGLSQGLPDWIHLQPAFRYTFSSMVLAAFGFFGRLRRLNASTVDELSQFDVCVFSGSETRLIPLVAPRVSGSPLPIRIFRPTGADLTVYPLFSRREMLQLRQDHGQWSMLRRLIYSLGYRFTRSYWRRSITAADYIDPHMEEKPFMDALQTLLPNLDHLRPLFRLAIDTDVFARREIVAPERLDAWGLRSDDFVVSFPSRMMMRNSPVLTRTGQWKANDVGIRGFAQFLGRVPSDRRDRIRLVIIDAEMSPDLDLARQLVAELDIESNTRFIRGESGHGLVRDEMIDLYSLSSVVLNDFGAGWYGSVAVEAMSCGSPVISYVDEAVMARTFEWHPFLSTDTAQGVSDFLVDLHSDPHKRERLGVRSREWIEKEHSPQAYLRRVEQHLPELLTP